MTEWFDHPLLLLILIVLNLPVYRILMEVIFGDKDGLTESIGYWFTPDIFSAFKGTYWDDQWAELKLGLYLVLCVLTVAAEYTGISKLTIWIQT